MTLIATPGASDANAYATVAEARAYGATRVGAASFLALSDPQIEQALITSATDIDTVESDPGFIGDRETDEQALAWPRDDGDIPTNLSRANIELAISYTPLFTAGAAGDALNGNPTSANIKREKVGPLETEYFAALTTAANALERLPGIVQRLLAPLIRPASTVAWGSAVVTRGS